MPIRYSNPCGPSSHLLHRLVGRLPSPAVPGLDAFTGLKSNAPSSETERA